MVWRGVGPALKFRFHGPRGGRRWFNWRKGAFRRVGRKGRRNSAFPMVRGRDQGQGAPRESGEKGKTMGGSSLGRRRRRNGGKSGGERAGRDDDDGGAPHPGGQAEGRTGRGMGGDPGGGGPHPGETGSAGGRKGKGRKATAVWMPRDCFPENRRREGRFLGGQHGGKRMEVPSKEEVRGATAAERSPGRRWGRGYP